MDSGDRPPAFSVFMCGGGGVKTTENQIHWPLWLSVYKLGGGGGGCGVRGKEVWTIISLNVKGLYYLQRIQFGRLCPNLKTQFWACIRENWVYKFGHWRESVTLCILCAS
jgi:hypothetical protein